MKILPHITDYNKPEMMILKGRTEEQRNIDLLIDATRLYVPDDRLTTLKRHFSELAMRAYPLHLALRFKREIAQSSSVVGLRKIGVRLVEEICG